MTITIVKRITVHCYNIIIIGNVDYIGRMLLFFFFWGGEGDV